MNHHLVLQLPLAMLYAAVYAYCFYAGYFSFMATGFAATYAPRYTVLVLMLKLVLT